jgi:hypothetical protein
MAPSGRERVLLGVVLAALFGLEVAWFLHGEVSPAESRWSLAARVLAQETVLLVGIWSLARRLFGRTEAAFFASVAAVGSTVWTGNADVELGTVCAVPLMIECARQRRWAAMVLLGGAQGVLLPPPLAPVAFLAVAAWFCAPRVEGKGFLLLIPAVGLTLLWDRALGNAGLRRPGLFLDFILGLGLSSAGTVFCGFLTAGLALSRAEGRDVLRLLLSLLVLGIASAAWGADAPVGVPWVRLAAVLAGAAGLSRLLEGDPLVRERAGRAGTGLLVTAAGLAALSAAVVLGRREVEDGLSSLGEPQDRLSDLAALSDLLGASALGAALAGGALLLAVSGRRAVPFALAVVLLLHPLDAFGWKTRMTWLGTVRREGP